MSDLLLTEDWDLTLDSYGNIAMTPSVAYSMAQQVANEIKLFYGEGWYDRYQGTPHFERVLGINTNIASIKTILTQRALGVDNVTQCEIDMYIDNDRCLHGNIFISDAEGNRANVYY